LLWIVHGAPAADPLSTSRIIPELFLLPVWREVLVKGWLSAPSGVYYLSSQIKLGTSIQVCVGRWWRPQTKTINKIRYVRFQALAVFVASRTALWSLSGQPKSKRVPCMLDHSSMSKCHPHTCRHLLTSPPPLPAISSSD